MFPRLFLFLFFILTTLPLILNGYPILNMDSSINIIAYNNVTSFLSPPPARPIFYSLFLFITSLGKTSLYLPCLAQDFIISYLVYELFIDSRIQQRPLFILTLIILPLSYLSVLSNSLMTDIWLGISFLSAYLILTKKSKNNIFFYIIICFSTMFAPANGLIILVSLFIAFLLLLAIKIRLNIMVLTYVFISTFTGLLIDSSDNYLAYHIFSPIASSNTFWVGRLIGDKLAQPSIEILCKKTDYKNLSACIDKSEYINRSGQNFLWESYKNGFNPWSLKNNKFFAAVKDRTILHNPVGFIRHILHGGISTLSSYPNNINDLYGRYDVISKSNWIYRTIRKYFNWHQMMNAWQQTSSNSFSYFRFTNVFIFILLSYALITNIKQIYRLNKDLIFVLLYSSLCIIINDFVDGGLSMVNPRYNVKGIGVVSIILCFIIASIPRISAASKVQE